MRETTSATGANVEALEIERMMDGERIICERRLRRSSRINPFNVQGVCDICGEEDPRMNFAVYTFPEERCSCCEGKHCVITKFCNKCSPLSTARFYLAHNHARSRAKEDLVRKYGKAYKDLLVKQTMNVAEVSATLS